MYLTNRLHVSDVPSTDLPFITPRSSTLSPIIVPATAAPRAVHEVAGETPQGESAEQMGDSVLSDRDYNSTNVTTIVGSRLAPDPCLVLSN